MSGVDVNHLAEEPLDRGDFPAERRHDFRVFFEPSAWKTARDHADADTSVEICGVLVGRLLHDEDGPFAAVEDCICCNAATSKFAEVTFTHESWAQINEEMDTKHAGKQIVGWYHSHPNFGVFLSDRDSFIHEHFFSGPGQVAYVIDPIRREEGLFVWRSGATQILPNYWVGNAIHSSVPHDASRGQPESQATPEDRGDTRAAHATAESEPWYAAVLPMLLLGLLAFYLGSLYNGYRTSWERERIVDGVVAHYGINKLAKIGLQEDLAVASDRLRELALAVKQPVRGKDDSEPTAEDLARHERMVQRGFRDLGRALTRIGETYGFDEVERMALTRYVAQKQSEMARAIQEVRPAKAVAPATGRGGLGKSPPPTPLAEEDRPADVPSADAKPAAADPPGDADDQPSGNDAGS